MKIIISPSKKQNRKCLIERELINPIFKNKSDQLREKLKHMNRDQLSSALNIKGNLLNKTEKKLNDSKTQKAAICCYNGLVFKQLEIKQYEIKEWNYMQKHLCILSAMYGILRPFTAIQPYRLDMKSKLKGINLYHFWQESVDEYFSNEDYIINLASNEFSKMLTIENYNGVFINVDFKEYDKNNKLRVVAARAKKARGLMLNDMIKNQISTIEELKKIEVLQYVFNEKISDDHQLVFIRKQLNN